jgi:uncharacterized SAM-binding protein YcdF (DUF218 family)
LRRPESSAILQPMALSEAGTARLTRTTDHVSGGEARLVPMGWGRWVLRVFASAALVVMLSLVAGFGLFIWMTGQDRAGETPTTDSVVVLTGGSQRIGEGLSLLGNGSGKRLLISGVNERTGYDEMLKLHPSSRDIMACCVDLGAQARNTIGNAIETRKWLKAHGFSSVTVVTSHYHMPRTLLEMRNAMPGKRIVPHAVVPDTADTERWLPDMHMMRILGGEYIKYLAASVRTRIERDPETSRLAVIFGGRKPVSPKIVSGTFVDAPQ